MDKGERDVNLTEQDIARRRKVRERRKKLERKKYLKRYEDMSASNIEKSRNDSRERLRIINTYKNIIATDDDPLSLIDLGHPLLTYRDRLDLEELIRAKGVKDKDINKKAKEDIKSRDKQLNKQLKEIEKEKSGLFLKSLVTFNLLGMKNAMGLRKKERELKKVKGRGKKMLGYLVSLIVPASLILAVITLMGIMLLFAGGFIASMMLSHPEAIKELYENGNLGDAMWMGNVYEDQVIDGEVVVKGNPYASPGCFVYNGVLYCGNCTVNGDSNGRDDSNCLPTGVTGDEGQGEFTKEAADFAKGYSATFIGDSLGVGVQSELSKYFTGMNFEVKNSRFMVQGSSSSTSDLNGVHVLREMAKSNKVKDVLVVALGTNGGLTQDMLETFYKEIPSNVKKVIFINTGSKGGSSGYDVIQNKEISRQIEEFVGKKDNAYYLDWLKYSHDYGWDKITSDSVHLNSEGNKLYAEFITQGVYDIENGSRSAGKCTVSGDFGDLKIGKIDDSKLREGVSVYQLEGLQPWVRKVLNVNSNLFQDSNTYSGYRAGDGGDHGSGLAIDYMTNNEGIVEEDTTEGDAVARWYIDNFEALNVKYVIWRQRIWLEGATEWTAMEHRGNPTQNHYDHVHISFKSGSGDMSKVKMPQSADAKIKPFKDTLKGGQFVDGAKCPTTGNCAGANSVKIDAKGIERQVKRDIIENGKMSKLMVEGNEGQVTEDFINQALKGMNDSPDSDVEDSEESDGSVGDNESDGSIEDNESDGSIEDIEDRVSVNSKDTKTQYDELGIDREIIDLIIAKGEPKENPGAISHSGYERGILNDFKITAKDPEWVDATYISKFLRNGYPDSKLIGHEDLIIDMADKHGIAIGVFFGQIATETVMGQVDCGGAKYNFGCVRYTENNPMGWGYVQVPTGKFLDPPSAEEFLDYWFDLIKTVYVDDNKIVYPQYLEKYSPAFENDHTKFEKNMYGVLMEFGYDLKTTETKRPGGGSKRDSSNLDKDTANELFVCPKNCDLTDSEREGGTGKNKPLPRGSDFENGDDLTRTDLGYTSDKVTPETLDKAIKELAPPDSIYIGLGDVFYRAGQESGYDPRYILAHAALETGWGTSGILRSKYNSFGIGAVDSDPFNQAYKYNSIEDGLITGAKWIYKNYYAGHQKTLYDMRHDPKKEGHNYATDPEWHTKIARNMAAIDKVIGGTTKGGSVVNSSAISVTATDSPTCTLEGTTLGTPLDVSMNPTVNYWYMDKEYSNHKGMDLVYPSGSNGQSANGPVMSVGDGEVVTVVMGCTDVSSGGSRNCGGKWGNHILIKHDDGLYSNYAHLQEGSLQVKPGDKVSRGDVIANMGNTGNSTGVHLHFEIWKGNSYSNVTDPYPYINWDGFNKLNNKEHPRKDSYGDSDLCKKGTEERKDRQRNNVPSGCAVTEDRSKPRDGTLQGDSFAEQVYHFFADLGYSDEAIAGILGNLMVESGVKPYIIQTRYDLTEETPIEELDKIDKQLGSANGYQGRGLVQWSRGGRWDTLEAWAKGKGMEKWELQTQLEFLAREMGEIQDPEVPVEYGRELIEKGSMPYGKGIKGYDNFKKTKSVEDAVYAFERFERASAAHVNFPQRVKYAKDFYARMAEWK